jgi:hypothetical protein
MGRRDAFLNKNGERPESQKLIKDVQPLPKALSSSVTLAAMARYRAGFPERDERLAGVLRDRAMNLTCGSKASFAVPATPKGVANADANIVPRVIRYVGMLVAWLR